VSAALSSCRHTMSGAVSRSQLSRFPKRRLMLLMLKLAIFIGSDRSENISGRLAPSVVHPNQNLMQSKVSERPAPPGRKRRLGRFEKLLGASNPMPVLRPANIRLAKQTCGLIPIPDRPAL
jgi:hypothetical protein